MTHRFQLLEMEYDDGGAPPLEIITKWLDVVQTTFHDAPDSSGPNGPEGPTIAVHCVAGLGRAPVLVAIALIEYGKVSGLKCAMLESLSKDANCRCYSHVCHPSSGSRMFFASNAVCGFKSLAPHTTRSSFYSLLRNTDVFLVQYVCFYVSFTFLSGSHQGGRVYSRQTPRRHQPQAVDVPRQL